ncbi:CTP:molybdopterin cytidylyltransferase MocA [Pseudooceanicola nitratireducens]|jgi:CTP:molybdopterin cytidylyltransferase MocA|uniref:CTP:molybdopterin cytidylyltransferase MocA n=1 Tax=Pseudooceanicola nitratireducens TaxID=517719 RepID=A0A1I1L6C0_9RHOB|nr:nucleotidyltransferase family protein [Pseudooceanicola nitratireducens]SEJ60040.1 CTP:molybdopterin cytidylyltransferase MocA [Pseudooceanicola nitratireducens]SFC68561.1 CTP:molybdopterin cytidylyltransferase MocA [Pseudooceanicola nitratireducens]
MDHPLPAILILAAGASSRMRGGDKQMEPVDGAPLIVTLARRALALAPTYVTLPGPDHPRSRALQGVNITPIMVPDAAKGMGASLRAGAAALPATTPGVMVLPSDMPEITTQDLADLAQAWAHNPDQIHRATDQDGTPGHPVLFPARLIPALTTLTGDQGARALLKNEKVRQVPLPDHHATTDLDTPEDWARWRAHP